MLKKTKSGYWTDKFIEVVRRALYFTLIVPPLYWSHCVNLAMILQLLGKIGKKEHRSKTGGIHLWKQEFGCHNFHITNRNIKIKKKTLRRSSNLPTSPSFLQSHAFAEHHVFQEAEETASWLEILFLHFWDKVLSNIYHLHKKNRQKWA